MTSVRGRPTWGSTASRMAVTLAISTPTALRPLIRLSAALPPSRSSSWWTPGRCARPGPRRARWRVPRRSDLPAAADVPRARRADDTVSCAIVSEVTLFAFSPRVDIETTIANAAQDHRLRALFPTPFPITSANAEDTFTVVNRPARFAIGSTKGWVEQPLNTHPHNPFAD